MAGDHPGVRRPTCVGRGRDRPPRWAASHEWRVASAPPASAPPCPAHTSSAARCSSPCRRSPASPASGAAKGHYSRHARALADNYTCARARLHAHTDTHTDTQVCILYTIQVHARTCIHACIYACTHMHAQSYTHVRISMCIFSDECADMYAHIGICAVFTRIRRLCIRVHAHTKTHNANVHFS